MAATMKVAVIGAGLGGLTTAAFLARMGADVTVYEQAEAFTRLGAGIILSPNVTRILGQLGLTGALKTRGIEPDAFLSRAWDTGETMVEVPFGASEEAEYGGPYINIHRADLHALLVSCLPEGTLKLGARLEGVDEVPGGVTLRFAGGETARADVVVGADGVNSRLRELIQGKAEPRFTGKMAQRTILQTSDIPGEPIRDCTKWWGPDRHILTYYMDSTRREVYTMGAIPGEGWAYDDNSIPLSVPDMVASFEGFHDDLMRVLKAATEATIWPIYDRPRNDNWAQGRMVLLGDACHPVRPFMAAGGAMAIEDAILLARALTSTGGDHATAFRAYMDARIPRVAKIQQVSFENSWMNGPTETDWFFRYDAASDPLKVTA